MILCTFNHFCINNYTNKLVYYKKYKAISSCNGDLLLLKAYPIHEASFYR